ncbi:hypothetical protein [Streptomyces sp. NPDC018693]|uniref:hypothetical protein n=1 Tax=unclassified Streptomyces TaxID=2593676 RepID=UPI0037A76160
MSHRLRTALSAVLIALSCLLLPFGTLAAWAAYDLTDTDRYVTAMGPLATDPAIRDAVAATVGDDLARKTGLTPAFAHDAAHSFTATRAFRTAWNAGNEAAHSAVMSALHDDTRTGPVTVDLAAVTSPLKRQLTDDHIPFAARVPVEHRPVPVLAAQDLAALRKGYHVLDLAAFWLPVAAVVLAAAGITVAVRRRRAVTATALGTALGGALLALAVAIGRRLTLADLPDATHRPAAAAVYDALTETLRTASWLLLALGLTAAALTWLSRRPRVLSVVRRRQAPAPPAPTATQARI